jgi:tetratricopeptide (TPR) repeat protein
VKKALSAAKRVARSNAVMCVAGAAFFRQQRAHAKPKLTDQDVLVVAGFDNKTGDKVFDSALKQALAFQLQQSPFVKAMDDAEVRQTMKLSGRPPDGRVTGEMARDICIREGQKATLEGSIAALGSRYLIALDAVNCQTGETFAREQTEAANKEHFVDALGRATGSMRAKLGESLSSIQSENRAYQNPATTSSLEALQAFYMGDEEWTRTARPQAAIPLYRRATELDPKLRSPSRCLDCSIRIWATEVARKNQLRRPTLSSTALLDLNRPDDAKAMPQEAISNGFDGSQAHTRLLKVGYAQGDEHAQQRETQWLASRQAEALALNAQAVNANALGHAGQAAELVRKSLELARQYPSEITPQQILNGGETGDALFGKCAPHATKGAAPIVMALCDAAAQKKFAEQRSVNGAAPIRGPQAYVRGLALLADGQAPEAAGVFSLMVDRKGANWGPEYAAAQVGLACAAKQMGDSARARKTYEQFFAFWKDADPDIPLPLEAPQRVCGLEVAKPISEYQPGAKAQPSAETM